MHASDVQLQEIREAFLEVRTENSKTRHKVVGVEKSQNIQRGVIATISAAISFAGTALWNWINHFAQK